LKTSPANAVLVIGHATRPVARWEKSLRLTDEIAGVRVGERRNIRYPPAGKASEVPPVCRLIGRLRKDFALATACAVEPKLEGANQRCLVARITARAPASLDNTCVS